MKTLNPVACDVTHVNQSPDRLLPMNEVLARVSISKTQLYRMINAGEFPKPLPIGGHRVAFVEAEVEAWIEQRMKMRDEGVGADNAPRSRACVRREGVAELLSSSRLFSLISSIN